MGHDFFLFYQGYTANLAEILQLPSSFEALQPHKEWSGAETVVWSFCFDCCLSLTMDAVHIVLKLQKISKRQIMWKLTFE